MPVVLIKSGRAQIGIYGPQKSVEFDPAAAAAAVRVANKKSIRPHCTLKEFSIADGGCGECSSEEVWSLLYETSAITGASRLAMQGCSCARRWVWLAVCSSRASWSSKQAGA